MARLCLWHFLFLTAHQGLMFFYFSLQSHIKEASLRAVLAGE